jgi:pentatricopeptide repeat protein
MVSAGVEPNVNTYSALIDGCARAGQVAKAFGAYGIMSSKVILFCLMDLMLDVLALWLYKCY